MFIRTLVFSALIVLLSGCADVAQLGTIAVEQRRTMNDIQARATMAATCDISIGAYFRELNEIERRYIALVCGGILGSSSPINPTLNTAPSPTPKKQTAYPQRNQRLIPKSTLSRWQRGQTI